MTALLQPQARDVFTHEDAAPGRHRDGIARAGLQSHARHKYRGRPTAHGGDEGIAAAESGRLLYNAPTLPISTAIRSLRQNSQQFALPNFFFFATTAYNILRHRGVPIGKRDFLGPVNWL
jgi:hypothetical protein